MAGQKSETNTNPSVQLSNEENIEEIMLMEQTANELLGGVSRSTTDNPTTNMDAEYR